MLVFSHLAGKEDGEAHAQNRDYDISNPIYQMLHVMSLNKDEAEEIYQDIIENGSRIYYDILDMHIRGMFPDASEFDIQHLMYEASQATISPHLAIARIIYYKYGSQEAAIYVMALLKNEAS